MTITTNTTTLTGPLVAQTTATVVGIPVEATATINADGSVTLTLDAATASTLLYAASVAATEADRRYRVGASSDKGDAYAGSTGFRLRTVVDAHALAVARTVRRFAALRRD